MRKFGALLTLVTACLLLGCKNNSREVIPFITQSGKTYKYVLPPGVRIIPETEGGILIAADVKKGAKAIGLYTDQDYTIYCVPFTSQNSQGKAYAVGILNRDGSSVTYTKDGIAILSQFPI